MRSSLWKGFRWIKLQFLFSSSPRKAEDCKDDVLKDGSEARRLALSLKGVAYGDQLVDELFSHSQKMEKLYEVVSGLLAKGNTSEGKYVKFVAAYQEKAAWFEKAKAGFYGHSQLSWTKNPSTIDLIPICL